MKMERVALLGAGAIGAYIVWGMAEALGERFCVVARGERKARLEQQGLIINDEPHKFPVKTPEEARGADLLFVACKQDKLAEALEDIRAVTDENTTVISLLNGITSEEIIGGAIGMEHVLPGFIRLSSCKQGNRVTFSPELAVGVCVGERDGQTSPRMLAVKELMDGTGALCNLSSDITLDMWMKYAGNVANNLPQAMLAVGGKAFADSTHLQRLAELLWKEVYSVARGMGVPLREKVVIFRDTAPRARYSTLQDLDAKRPTEIESLAGDLIRMAAQLGLAVPCIEFTYHMIKALEEKNRGMFDY